MKAMLKRYFFSNYKSKYGQGGILTFSLTKGNYNVNMNTIWDDETRLTTNSESKDDGWEFYDNERECQINNSSDGIHTLFAEIPEFYSYNGFINGNLNHKQSQIDAKICGDIDLEIKGQFIANKIKSENFNLKCDSIQINSYLETANCSIQSNSNIGISKILVKNSGIIKQNQGSMIFKSIYTQPIKYKILNKQEFQDYFNYSPTINIESINNDQTVIGQCQGGFKMKIDGKLLTIRSLSGVFNIEHTNSVAIGLSGQSQGIIKAKSIDLKVFKDLKVNILNNGKEQNGYNVEYCDLYTYSDKFTLELVDNIFGF